MNKINKLFSLLLLLLVLTLTSCQKINDEIQSRDAVVIFEGNPDADGCGWLLLIDNQKYKPVNLNKDILIDKLNVIVEYKKLDTKCSCNWRAIEYSEVEIINITIK